MKDWADGPFGLNTNDFYIISVAYPNGFGSEPVLQVLYDNLRPQFLGRQYGVCKPLLCGVVPGKYK